MKHIITTDHAPKAIGPYSQAIEINGTLYISGQIALGPDSGAVIEGGIAAQTEQVLKNVGAILEAAGYSYSNVVKSTVMLASMDHFKEMNEVYGRFYALDPPARAAYEVSKLPLGALVEIETIAVR